MNTPGEKWLARLGRLRVDQKGNPAPHKPLLLLTVIEMVEAGFLTEPRLHLSGDLTFRFLALWPIVAARRNQAPEIWLPFYHLKTSRIWIPLDANGVPTDERRRAVMAQIGPEFFDCLLDPGFRDRLRLLLIDRYFTDPAERSALAEFANVPLDQADRVNDTVAAYESAHRIVREARFRLTVVPAYDYTCALTGYKLVTAQAGSIVDAAHIHPFANSRNNDPRNGLALSKNAHWAFDQGLWSLSDDYRVLLATTRFKEMGPASMLLAAFEGKRIHLPKEESLWPDPRHLSWHRQNRLDEVGLQPSETMRSGLPQSGSLGQTSGFGSSPCTSVQDDEPSSKQH